MADTARLLSEIEAGKGKSLSAAACRLPGYRGNASVNASTLFRWVTKGVRDPTGRLVRLEAVRLGARWVTTEPALIRFVEALSATANLPEDREPVRSPSSLLAGSRRAGERLTRQHGI